jgi:hypothetical protein
LYFYAAALYHPGSSTGPIAILFMPAYAIFASALTFVVAANFGKDRL